MTNPSGSAVEIDRDHSERGSALVLAIFVLVLLTAIGTALLFVSQNEVKMSKSDLNSKHAFYIAEAGLEDARATIHLTNGNGPLSDDLVAAAGPNGVIDFDAQGLTPLFDGRGNVTGFTGYGDDVPLAPLTAFGDGVYAAFLTNDPREGKTNTTDLNDRVMITAVGTGFDHSLELVQAVVEPETLMPSLPPATIVMLGPSPVFDGADTTCVAPPGDDDDEGDDGSDGSGGSGASDDEGDDEDSASPSGKAFIGTDCDGAGEPGLFVPVLGAIDGSAEADIESGVGTVCTNVYTSDTYGDMDTVADMSDDTEPTVIGSGYGALDPDWQDCDFIHDMLEELRNLADSVCVGGACSIPGGTTASSITFIDGDLTTGSSDAGRGLLIVTGRLDFHADSDWNGVILAVGEGVMVRSGSGNGAISGSTVIANIAGADGAYGTADDCIGGSAGFRSASYQAAATTQGDTVYCSTDIIPANPLRTYDVVQFRQR